MPIKFRFHVPSSSSGGDIKAPARSPCWWSRRWRSAGLRAPVLVVSAAHESLGSGILGWGVPEGSEMRDQGRAETKVA